MRLAVAPTAALLVAWMLTSAAGMTAPHSQPQYIGTVTGDPEHDTYGYVVPPTPEEMLCIVGPKQYFGSVTGDPEQDTYGYVTAMVRGTSCPPVVVSQTQ